MQCLKTMAQSIEIKAADGRLIPATFFAPTQFEQVVLVVPGVGIPARFYAAFGEYLKANGIAAYTFDYRGIGKAAPSSLRGFDASVTDWAEQDIEGMWHHVEKEHTGKKRFIVAHSGGGTILGLAPSVVQAEKIVMVASPKCHRARYQGMDRFKMWMIVFLFYPLLSRLFGYFPSKLFKLGENLPAKVAREWGRWGRHPAGMIGWIGEKQNRFEAITCPVLTLSFDHDFFANRDTVIALKESYTSAALQHQHITHEDAGGKPVGHFCFFKERYLPDLGPKILDFLKNRETIDTAV